MQQAIKVYFTLTKPGILLGNLITAAAGFLLGGFNLLLMVGVLLGLGLVMASSCVCNNYIDRKIDAQMARTKSRPLATGKVVGRDAVIFALALAAIGSILLFALGGWLPVALSLLGLVVYVFLYSFLKYRTEHCTLVGTIAGSMPPLAAYTAVTGQVDGKILYFFLLIALWQMPHFFAIALYRLDDYAAVSIPVVPVIRGIPAAKRQMAIYSVLLLLACAAPLSWFSVVTVPFAALWCLRIFRGFSRRDDVVWARGVFKFSLFVVLALCVGIFGL